MVVICYKCKQVLAGDPKDIQMFNFFGGDLRRLRKSGMIIRYDVCPLCEMSFFSSKSKIKELKQIYKTMCKEDRVRYAEAWVSDPTIELCWYCKKREDNSCKKKNKGNVIGRGKCKDFAIDIYDRSFSPHDLYRDTLFGKNSSIAWSGGYISKGYLNFLKGSGVGRIRV